jgi:hypothetical protein
MTIYRVRFEDDDIPGAEAEIDSDHAGDAAEEHVRQSDDGWCLDAETVGVVVDGVVWDVHVEAVVEYHARKRRAVALVTP